jgi:hypothetical protein
MTPRPPKRRRAPAPSPFTETGLAELGVAPGDQVRFRRHDGERWKSATVARREKDGSVGLHDARGGARSIVACIEVRGLGPRGGVVWEPLAERAARTEQLALVRPDPNPRATGRRPTSTRRTTSTRAAQPDRDATATEPDAPDADPATKRTGTAEATKARATTHATAKTGAAKRATAKAGTGTGKTGTAKRSTGKTGTAKTGSTKTGRATTGKAAVARAKTRTPATAPAPTTGGTGTGDRSTGTPRAGTRRGTAAPAAPEPPRRGRGAAAPRAAVDEPEQLRLL